MRRPADRPRAARIVRPRRVGRNRRCASRPQSVLLVTISQSDIEFLRERLTEEGVQLERGLLDEARGELFHRACLEVDGVEEFGEERDVVL